MWLSDRKNSILLNGPTRRQFLLGLGALPMSACGFEPALGPKGSLGAFQNRIRVADPNDRNEFTLKSALEDRFGRGQDFDLTYRIETDTSDIGITPERVLTGPPIVGSVDFTLKDTATGAVLLSDTVSGFTSFGTTGTTASTAFANEAALDRLMVILAEHMIRRLALMQKVPK